jgi:hypothetical protein
VFVGDQGFTDGNVFSASIAIDSKDIPYIGIRDAGNGSKASVMKFDGTDWVFVGTAGFSDGIANSVIIALDGQDTPYISLSDFASDGKITVRKFDGTDWVAVGSKTFSDGKMAFQSLAFDSNDTPWVAYQEFGSTRKATIMKFNGTDWEPFGEKSFTESSASYTSLVFDANDVHYLAFQDGSNSSKVSVLAHLKGNIAGSVVENQSVAITITATDIDEDTLTFSITGGDDKEKFSIDADTGELSFKEAPDYENPSDQGADNVYELVVKVQDPDEALDTASVEITVSDTNEAPVITSSGGGNVATAAIDENVDSVLTVAGSDDEGDSIIYSISGGEDSDLLQINPDTGELSFLSTPDFENPGDTDGNNTFIVEITVTSEGGTAVQTLVINLTNTNDNAPDLESAQYTIAETLSVNSEVGTTPDAADVDGDSLTFSILEGNSEERFSIETQTGQILVASELDYETTTSFTLILRADDGTLASSAPIVILVMNENDNEPEIEGESFSTLENRDLGVEIGTPIEAEDADGDDLTYSIAGGNDGDAFEIDPASGQIRVAGQLDFESQNLYVLTIKASDGVFENRASVTIQVTDLDDTPPTIKAIQIPSPGSYGPGKPLRFSLRLDEEVIIDTSGGEPRLALIIGGKTVFATFVEGGAADELIFEYIVEEGQLDENGIQIGSELDLGGSTIKDKAGNELDLDLPSTNTTTITIDAVPPQIPPPPLSSGDDRTSDPRPAISGTAEPGSTVILRRDGKIIAEVPVDEDGKWSYKPEEDLEPGPHSFTITSKDRVGNESEESEPLNFEVVPEEPPSPLEILNTLIEEDKTGNITRRLLEDVGISRPGPGDLEDYQKALKENGPIKTLEELQDLIDEVDVKAACEMLAISELIFPNESANQIRESFELPLKISEVELDWVSGDVNTITHLGNVHRPDGSQGDATVFLTVTLSKGSQSVAKSYPLKVIAKPLKNQFGEVESQEEGDGEKVSVPLSDEFSDVTTSTMDFESTEPTIEATPGKVCLEADLQIPDGSVHLESCHISDEDLKISYEGNNDSETTSNVIKTKTPEYEGKLDEEGNLEIKVPIDEEPEEEKSVTVTIEPDGTVTGEVTYKDEEGEEKTAKIVSDLEDTNVEITEEGELIFTGSTSDSEGETITVKAKVTDSGSSLTGVKTPDGVSTVFMTLPGVNTIIEEDGEVTSKVEAPNEGGSVDITATTTDSGWINLIQKQFDEQGELIAEETKQFQPGSKITVTGGALVRSETKIEGNDKGSVTITDDEGNEVETKLETQIPSEIRETEDGSIEASATGKDSQGEDVGLIATAKVDGRVEHSVKVGSKETKATSEIEGAQTTIKSDGVETSVEVKSTPTSNAVDLVVSADNDGKSEHLLVIKDAAGNETGRVKAKSDIPGTKTSIKQDQSGKAFVETSVTVLGTQDEKLDIKVSGNVDGEATHEIQLTLESGETVTTKADFKIPGASTQISQEGSVETTASLGEGTQKKLIKVNANPNGTASHAISFQDSTGKTITTSAISEVKGAETAIAPTGVVSTSAVPRSGISTEGFFIRAVVETRPDGESITFFEKVDTNTNQVLQTFRTNAASTPFEPDNKAKIREVAGEPILEIEAGVSRTLLFE